MQSLRLASSLLANGSDTLQTASSHKKPSAYLKSEQQEPSHDYLPPLPPLPPLRLCPPAGPASSLGAPMKTLAQMQARQQSPLRRNKTIEADYYAERQQMTQDLRKPKQTSSEKKSAIKRESSPLTRTEVANIRYMREVLCMSNKAIADASGHPKQRIEGINKYQTWCEVDPSNEGNKWLS